MAIAKRSDVKNHQNYLEYISQKKQFIMQHLMKIFYYWNLDESDNLANPEWTIEHWINEIGYCLDINSIGLSSFDTALYDNLYNALYIVPDYETNIKYLKDLMAKNWSFEAHKLPIISDRTLKRKWKAFCVAYKRCINIICDRMLYENSKIHIRTLLNFWLSMAKKCSANEQKMKKVSEKYEDFSNLTEKLRKINKDLSELIR